MKRIKPTLVSAVVYNFSTLCLMYVRMYMEHGVICPRESEILEGSPPKLAVYRYAVYLYITQGYLGYLAPMPTSYCINLNYYLPGGKLSVMA